MSEFISGLYLVPTPIGNLGDMTFRGVEVLKNADVIAAEDTRHSRILLEHYGITTPLLSYHEHNAASRRDELLTFLSEGKIVALITDAGTPGISDPGEDITKAAIEEGYTVVPLPGSNAPLTALIGSGLPCRYFAFEGFLPRVKKERRQRLDLLKNETRTTVIYVAPHRLKEDLKDILFALGNRRGVLCRELTKIHETFHRGTLDSLLDKAEQENLKGEMVLVIEGAAEVKAEVPSKAELKDELKQLIDSGKSAKDAVKDICKKYTLAKNEVYPLAFLIKENKEIRK